MLNTAIRDDYKEIVGEVYIANDAEMELAQTATALCDCYY